MLAMWLVGQTGTLFLYQGQEIGMINAPKGWSINEYKDVESQNFWKEAVRLSEDGSDPTRKERIMHGLQLMARDHSRLPFQWDSSQNAGFTTGVPWMRVHDLFKEINAASQEGDPDSVLSFYKRMLRLRKEHKDVFVYGSFELVDPEDPYIFVYRKHYQEKSAMVALNFTARPQSAPASHGMTMLASTYSKTLPEVLQPFEGRMYINY
jgi:alpha-glucosidase